MKIVVRLKVNILSTREIKYTMQNVKYVNMMYVNKFLINGKCLNVNYNPTFSSTCKCQQLVKYF